MSIPAPGTYPLEALAFFILAQLRDIRRPELRRQAEGPDLQASVPTPEPLPAYPVAR